MSKIRSVVVGGLALVLLAACERSSAVATRTESGDRHPIYEQTGSTEPVADNGQEARSTNRGDSRSQDPVRRLNGKAIWSSSRKGSAEENAQRSFARNGEDFGARDLDSYIRKAQAFVGHPPAGAQTLKRVNGDVLIYDAKDNVFAVATKDGVPRAMFKPDQGAAYWDIQKARETKRRMANSERRSSDTEG
ncbi:MAG: hypothetical protein CGW95_14815 [Phenylobacterium zucineum]|nr:MAG: hypothetical protein CGW95_14815 [Phenylobacterium zucineum]